MVLRRENHPNLLGQVRLLGPVGVADLNRRPLRPEARFIAAHAGRTWELSWRVCPRASVEARAGTRRSVTPSVTRSAAGPRDGAPRGYPSLSRPARGGRAYHHEKKEHPENTVQTFIGIAADREKSNTAGPMPTATPSAACEGPLVRLAVLAGAYPRGARQRGRRFPCRLSRGTMPLPRRCTPGLAHRAPRRRHRFPGGTTGSHSCRKRSSVGAGKASAGQLARNIVEACKGECRYSLTSN